jgi:hypothetical protein
VKGDDGAARRLAGEFTREMLDICDRFKREIDYNPVRFRQSRRCGAGPAEVHPGAIGGVHGASRSGNRRAVGRHGGSRVLLHTRGAPAALRSPNRSSCRSSESAVLASVTCLDRHSRTAPAAAPYQPVSGGSCRLRR